MYKFKYILTLQQMLSLEINKYQFFNGLNVAQILSPYSPLGFVSGVPQPVVLPLFQVAFASAILYLSQRS